MTTLPTPYSLLPQSTPSPQPRRQRSPAPDADSRWLTVEEWLRSPQFDNNTRKQYGRELRRFLEWSDANWADITPRHLRHYIDWLTALPNLRGNPRKGSSTNAGVTAIRSFCRWMTTNYPDRLPTNPAAHLEFCKVPAPSAQSLSDEQMMKVWAALEQLGQTRLRDTALVHILRDGGLREEEATRLNLGSLHGKVLFLADTKNDQPREVPMPNAAIAAIAAYLTWREAQGEHLTADRPLLLSHHPGHRGERLTPGGVYLAVDRLGKLAGIPELHPHLFRHTYATNLLSDGLDPLHAMQLTGHRDEKSFKRYTQKAKQQAAIAAYYKAIGEEA